MKNWFKRFIERLEKSNKEVFGDQKLDCCDLNKQGQNKKIIKKSNNR